MLERNEIDGSTATVNIHGAVFSRTNSSTLNKLKLVRDQIQILCGGTYGYNVLNSIRL